MKKEYDFHSIIKSLSYAMDLISTTLVGHHKRVAYLSYRLALELDLENKEIKKLVAAALIHDLGIFYLDQDYQDLSFDNKNNFHAEVGYRLLKKNSFDLEIAEIIKYHHHDYSKNPNKLSNILHFADRIAVLILDNQFILDQLDHLEKVIEDNRELFCPDCIDSFFDLTENVAFLLDITSDKVITKELDKYCNELEWNLDLDEFLEIARLISHIIDFRSPFTATHSQGLAAVAPALAQRFNYKEKEYKEIEAAAYLHDIGKLFVPTKILNKKEKLSKSEWNILKTHTYYTYQALSSAEELHKIRDIAANHHEKLDGQGYPFQLDQSHLGLSERIMAVADIFTAISEDRPYREGMKAARVKSILKEMSLNNKIDKNVVAVLLDNYSEIDELRAERQKKAKNYYQDFKEKIETEIFSVF